MKQKVRSRLRRDTLEDALWGLRVPKCGRCFYSLPAWCRGPSSALGACVSGSCPGSPVRPTVCAVGWTTWQEAFCAPSL